MAELPFAFFGGPPAFDLPVGLDRSSRPSWHLIEAGLREVFERRYYTNNGPKVKQLERAFSGNVGSAEAIAVANDSLAFMVIAKGLDLCGEVLLSALAPTATIEALRWAGLTPVLCDVDSVTYALSPGSVERLIGSDTSAIIATHRWGSAHASDDFVRLARQHDLRLVFDATGASAARHGGRPIEALGDAAVFSFESSAAPMSNGACIATNDPNLAAKMRTIRGFSASNVKVSLRCNGKMSEAQATLALLALESIPETAVANAECYRAYARGLSELQGIALVPRASREEGDAMPILIEIDETRFGLDRDDILALLKAENVICTKPFASPDPAFSVAHRLGKQILSLPNSMELTVSDVECICVLLQRMLNAASSLRTRLARKR